jgi:hypothetical protein
MRSQGWAAAAPARQGAGRGVDDDGEGAGHDAALLAGEVVAGVVHGLQSDGGHGWDQLTFHRGLGQCLAVAHAGAEGAKVWSDEAAAPPGGPRRALLLFGNGGVA